MFRGLDYQQRLCACTCNRLDCWRCGQVINPVDYHLNDMIMAAKVKAGKGVFNHAFSSAVSMFLAKFIAHTNAAQVSVVDSLNGSRISSLVDSTSMFAT